MTDNSGKTLTPDKPPEKAEARSPEPDGFSHLPPTPMRAMQRLGGWRALRSMRTAIWLLLALVAATLLPTLVPQELANPQGVQDWKEKWPAFSDILERLHLFDVFSAPWFVAIYAALLVVLVLCLVPRSRAFVRQVRRAVRRPGEGALPDVALQAEWVTALPAADAARHVVPYLRRRRWRVGKANAAGQCVAEKGAAREGGSLLFHWSFLVLMAGLFVSAMFGWSGYAVLVEGQEWVETPMSIIQYDPPVFFEDSAHRDFTLTLDAFDVRYRDDGSAADFVASVRVADGGEPVIVKEVRVNDPLDYRGVKAYLHSFGWAARIVVTDPVSGDEVFDDWVILEPGGPRNMHTGVVKIPSIRPQAGLELFFAPTGVVLTQEQAATFDDELGPNVLLAQRPGPPTPDAPVVYFREYRGNLGLDRPQPIGVLDKSRLGDPVDIGAVTPGGDAFELEDGLEVSFRELRQYSRLQVKRDPGLGLVAAAGVLLLVGLVPSLYLARRRLWIWIRPDPDGRERTVITLGGLAYQRKEAFNGEFEDLHRRLEALAPTDADSGATPKQSRKST